MSRELGAGVNAGLGWRRRRRGAVLSAGYGEMSRRTSSALAVADQRWRQCRPAAGAHPSTLRFRRPAL